MSKNTTSANAEISYTASFDGLVDIVNLDGSSAFLVKEASGLTICSRYDFNGEAILPPPATPWMLADAHEVEKAFHAVIDEKIADAALYDDLKEYHRSISDLPSEVHYDVLAAWDLHTYVLEGVQFSPVMCFYAEAERGKTRTGKGMIYAAYRGIYTSSLREAYILRASSHYGCSLFIDVRDAWQKITENQSDDVILGRFEKGVKMPRVMYPEKGPYLDTEYFSVFGPTVLATNEPIDHTLESRGITIPMYPSDKRFDNNVVESLSLPLRVRLLAFRARRLGRALPEMPKPDIGRLGDVMKPLLQIIRAVRPERELAVIEFVQRLSKNKKASGGLSIEASLVEAVIKSRAHVKHASLPVKTITDMANSGKSVDLKISYQKAGRILDALGFDKGKTSEGSSAVLWDESKIQKMAKAFGVSMPEAEAAQ